MIIYQTIISKVNGQPVIATHRFKNNELGILAYSIDQKRKFVRLVTDDTDSETLEVL